MYYKKGMGKRGGGDDLLNLSLYEKKIGKQKEKRRGLNGISDRGGPEEGDTNGRKLEGNQS